MNKKKVIKQCEELSNKFLSLALSWKELGRSLRQSKDRGEVKRIGELIKKKVEVLEKYYKEDKE